MSATEYNRYLVSIENTDDKKYLRLIDSIFTASEIEDEIANIENNRLAYLNQQIKSLQSTLKSTPAEEKPNKIAEIKTINSQKITEENNIQQLQRELDIANANIVRSGPEFDGITMNKKKSIFVDWIKNKININDSDTIRKFNQKIKKYPYLQYTSNSAKQIANTEILDLKSKSAFDSVIDNKKNILRSELPISTRQVLLNDDLSSNISSYLRGGYGKKTKYRKYKTKYRKYKINKNRKTKKIH